MKYLTASDMNYFPSENVNYRPLADVKYPAEAGCEKKLKNKGAALRSCSLCWLEIIQ